MPLGPGQYIVGDCCCGLPSSSSLSSSEESSSSSSSCSSSSIISSSSSLSSSSSSIAACFGLSECPLPDGTAYVWCLTFGDVGDTPPCDHACQNAFSNITICMEYTGNCTWAGLGPGACTYLFSQFNMTVGEGLATLSINLYSDIIFPQNAWSGIHSGTWDCFGHNWFTKNSLEPYCIFGNALCVSAGTPCGLFPP